MQCEEVDEILEAYVAGYLADEPKAEFEQHLRRCPECLKRVKLAQRVLTETGNFFESMDLGRRDARAVGASALVDDLGRGARRNTHANDRHHGGDGEQED